MPQVPGAPYEPYPTVAPAERVLRPGGVPEVPAAYGVGVANAISLFGGDVEKAGKEVFDSALALRKLQAETYVRDAVTQHYNNVAPDQSAFMAAQGANANADALKQHLESLDARRMAARAEVQKQYGVYGASLFDADTAAMSRNYVNQASLHSAQQVKVAAGNSIDARARTIDDSIQSDPTNNATYVQGLKDRRILEVEKGRLLGLPQDEIDQNISDATSGITRRRIIGTAVRGDDEGAQALLDQAIKDKIIKGDIADKTQEQIRTQAHRNLTYATAVDTEMRRAENDSLKKDANKIFAQNVSVDDNGNVVINPQFQRQAVMLTQTHPAAENAEPTAKTMIDWFEAKQKPRPVRNSPEVADRLNARLFDPNNPLTELDTLRAEADALQGRPGIDGKLGNVLRQTIKARDGGALKDPILKDTLAAVKSKLAWDALGGTDVGGVEAYARFSQAFYPAYIALSTAGRGMAVGALNMADPNSLVSTAMETARNGASMQERLRAAAPPAPAAVPAAPAPTPTPPPPPPQMRQPGETLSDWLTRTKAPQVAPPISR